MPNLYHPSPLPRKGLVELANQLEMELAVISKLLNVPPVASTSTTTIVSSGSGGSSVTVSDEQIMDVVAALIADGDNLAWTYDDAADTLTGNVTGDALTKSDDTNVTLTLTGTPATALLEAVNLGLGWTGTLADARLSTTAVTPGTYGSATEVGQFTVGATGRITFAQNVTISGVAPSAHNLLSASHGDTVANTVSRGSLIYGNSTPAWDELVIGAANRLLRSDGTDASWAQVALATDVSGVLPMANGGSNKALTASAGGMVWTDSDSMEVLAGTATAGLALVSGASATPSWFTPTAGSVLFAGTGGILAQDNATFYFDDTNDILHVGNIDSTATQGRVRIYGTNTVTGVLRVRTMATNAAIGGGVILYHNNAAEALAAANDRLGYIIFGSIDAGTVRNGGSFEMLADGAYSSTSAPTRARILTATTGSLTRVERMLWDSVGNVGLGQSTFGTSAVKVFAIGEGTAPSTSPTNAIQMWSADYSGGAVNGLNLRSEDGTLHHIGTFVSHGHLNPTHMLEATGAILNTTYSRVGSLTSPTNVTAGDATVSRLSIGNKAFGTSATLGLVWESGVAPSAAHPTDAVQMWVADRTAGAAGLFLRSENGVSYVLADRSGFGTTTPTYLNTFYRNDSAVDPQLSIEQDGSGDAVIHWSLTGVSDYMMGLDQSDGNKLKIVASSTDVGAGTALLTIVGNPLFGIFTDTPSSLLHVGTSGTVGHLRMDGIAGDPGTVTAGDLWYNTTQKSMRYGTTVGTHGAVGVVYSNTADSNVVDTAGEEDFNTQFTFPANSLTVGKKIRVSAWGRFSCNNASPTVAIKIYLGTNELTQLANVSVSPGVAQTHAAFRVDALITVVSVGASGTVIGSTDVNYVNQGRLTNRNSTSGGTTVVDTTATALLKLSGTWSSTGGGVNVMVIQQMYIEVLD